MRGKIGEKYLRATDRTVCDIKLPRSHVPSSRELARIKRKKYKMIRESLDRLRAKYGEDTSYYLEEDVEFYQD